MEWRNTIQKNSSQVNILHQQDYYSATHLVLKRMTARLLSTGGEDLGDSSVLSNLPVDILRLIISNLPTKEAVATSILSRRWRWQWNYVSRLDLKLQNSEFTKSENFYVHNLLMKLKPRSIRTCRISHYCQVPDDRLIYTLQYLLNNMGIEELAVNYYPGLTPASVCGNLAIPEGFFNSTSLRKLELHNHSIMDERPFNGCVNLKTLMLCNVWIEEKTLGDVISVCWSLENLLMEDCGGFTTFKIDDNWNLKRLEIKGSTLSSHVCNFKVHAEGLEFLSIKSLRQFSWHNCVIKCSNLKTLKLNCGPICFRFPIPYFQNTWIPGPFDTSVFGDGTFFFSNLTVLHTTMDLNRTWTNLILRALFRECTKLQQVDIVNEADKDDRCDIMPHESSFWETIYHDGISVHLRLFRITGFRGREREMRLVDYLIKNASKLEKLIIQSDNKCPKEGVRSKLQKKVKQEILSIQRSSSDVSIIFG